MRENFSLDFVYYFEYNIITNSKERNNYGS
nr:MAG TPA: hypothetical protein [Caudoviricetes sp.]